MRSTLFNLFPTSIQQKVCFPPHSSSHRDWVGSEIKSNSKRHTYILYSGRWPLVGLLARNGSLRKQNNKNMTWEQRGCRSVTAPSAKFVQVIGGNKMEAQAHVKSVSINQSQMMTAIQLVQIRSDWAFILSEWGEGLIQIWNQISNLNYVSQFPTLDPECVTTSTMYKERKKNTKLPVPHLL